MKRTGVPLFTALALVLATAGCGGDGFVINSGRAETRADSSFESAAARPSSSAPAAPTLSVEGAAVIGADVTFVAEGLEKYIGKMASVTFTLKNHDGVVVSGGRIGQDGTVRISGFIPEAVGYEPAVEVDNTYLLILEVDTGDGSERVLETTVTTVAAEIGTKYRTGLVTECGRPHIYFDGAVFAQSEPTVQPTPKPIPGQVKLLSADRATFTFEDGNRIELTRVSKPDFLC